LIEPLESLFYYDIANGLDFDYYNSTRGYTPVFAAQPTPQQEAEAQRVCTRDDVLNVQCAYDYYATGNAEASSVTATVFTEQTTEQETLGLCLVW